jgi:AraC-like DNA-binding protein
MADRGAVRFEREPGGVRTVAARGVRPEFIRHAHQSWVIGLAERGGRCMDMAGVLLEIPEGGVFVVPPDTPHACAPLGPPPHAHRAVCLPDETLRMLLDADTAPRPGTRPRFPDGTSPWSTRAVAERERLKALKGAVGAVPGLAGVVRGRRGETEKNGRRAEVERAARYLAENARNNPTLDQAARYAGLSPFHLHRLFVFRFGIAPHAFVIRERLRLAIAALEAGEGPAGAAAWAGFTDQSHFTRHFRRAVGVTPGRFAVPSPRTAARPGPWG